MSERCHSKFSSKFVVLFILPDSCAITRNYSETSPARAVSLMMTEKELKVAVDLSDAK